MSRRWTKRFSKNRALVVAFGLILVGLYLYRFAMKQNSVYGLILFVASSVAMIGIFRVWQRFTEKYAHRIIYWVTQHKWLRKLVAGGSFSYYEYKPDTAKTGLFEPVSRFMTLMIGFVGLSSAFANIFGINPESPVADIGSVIVWSILIFIIPIILTPIIPIIWTMEDLQLKSWDAKNGTNVKVSVKYKMRFNSFIAISTLGVAYSLSSDPGVEPLVNIQNFLTLLLWGVIILTYPISLLTSLYYLYFRGKVNRNVREQMNIPIAETKLVFRNQNGEIVDSKFEALVTEEIAPEDLDTDTEDDERSLPQKITDKGKETIQQSTLAVKTQVDKMNKNLRKVFTRKKDEPETKNLTKGGSATRGLWDHEEDE